MKFLILLALVGFAAAQVQIQIPIFKPPRQQFPEQQQQWQQPPQWQEPPQQQNGWRAPSTDTRCPVVDPVDFPVFAPGATPQAFWICWGPNRAWPFTCPGNTVFRTEVNVCADPGWTPDFGRTPIRPRPFENDDVEDEEDEE